MTLRTSLAEAILAKGDRHAHSQEQSSLFSKLPSELREAIFTYAVASYNDAERPFEVNTHYFRPPRFTHFQRIDTSLLLTCRRVYVESCHLPLSSNTMVFWGYRGPRGEPPSQRSIGLISDILDYDEDDTSWHFARFRKCPETPIHLLRRAHWFTQQYWLECDNFLNATESREMAHVQHLTLTIRRGDQWNFTDLRPVGVDPRWPAAVTEKRMKEIWSRDGKGVEVPYHPDAFGSHIRNLRNLQELVFEIEGEVSQTEELEAIVHHAQVYWKFPHHDGRWMVAAKDIQREYWRGPPCLMARRTGSRLTADIIKFALTFRLNA